MLKIGDSAEIKKQFTESDVNLFAELSLDKNPIHLDDAYAKNSFFKEKIVHGFLYSSLISAVIANKLPGEGSIYLSQTLKFLKPVKINDEITAKVVLSEINSRKKVFSLETSCFNQKNEKVVEGTALIKNTNEARYYE